MTKEIKTCSVCGKRVRKDFLDGKNVRYCAEHKHLRKSKKKYMSTEEFWKGLEELGIYID